MSVLLQGMLWANCQENFPPLCGMGTHPSSQPLPLFHHIDFQLTGMPLRLICDCVIYIS